jgi:hypothetical protein
MSAKVVSRTDTSSDPIARRALDLASDRALPLTDAVRQLLELADARLAPLELALADLRRRPAGADVDDARILVRSAIGAAAVAPFFGGPGTHLPA